MDLAIFAQWPGFLVGGLQVVQMFSEVKAFSYLRWEGGASTLAAWVDGESAGSCGDQGLLRGVSWCLQGCVDIFGEVKAFLAPSWGGGASRLAALVDGGGPR